jgi:hypothetical protein
VAIFLEQTLEDATEPVVILDYEEMHDLAPLDLATDRGLMIGGRSGGGARGIHGSPRAGLRPSKRVRRDRIRGRV